MESYSPPGSGQATAESPPHKPFQRRKQKCPCKSSPAPNKCLTPSAQPRVMKMSRVSCLVRQLLTRNRLQHCTQIRRRFSNLIFRQPNYGQRQPQQCFSAANDLTHSRACSLLGASDTVFALSSGQGKCGEPLETSISHSPPLHCRSCSSKNNRTTFKRGSFIQFVCTHSNEIFLLCELACAVCVEAD